MAPITRQEAPAKAKPATAATSRKKAPPGAPQEGGKGDSSLASQTERAKTTDWSTTDAFERSAKSSRTPQATTATPAGNSAAPSKQSDPAQHVQDTIVLEPYASKHAKSAALSNAAKGMEPITTKGGTKTKKQPASASAIE